MGRAQDQIDDFFGRRSSGAVLLEVVGEAHYQPAIREARRREEGREILVLFKREPENPHDVYAVQVCDQHTGNVLGYLERSAAKQFNACIDALQGRYLDAVIVGGRPGESYGVYIDATCLRELYDNADPKRRAAAERKKQARLEQTSTRPPEAGLASPGPIQARPTPDVHARRAVWSVSVILAATALVILALILLTF